MRRAYLPLSDELCYEGMTEQLWDLLDISCMFDNFV
jgi:hypothetical protein